MTRMTRHRMCLLSACQHPPPDDRNTMGLTDRLPEAPPEAAPPPGPRQARLLRLARLTAHPDPAVRKAFMRRSAASIARQLAHQTGVTVSTLRRDIAEVQTAAGKRRRRRRPLAEPGSVAAARSAALAALAEPAAAETRSRR